MKIEYIHLYGSKLITKKRSDVLKKELERVFPKVLIDVRKSIRLAYLTITRKYVELSIEPALLILMASKTNLLTIMTLFKEKTSVLFCLTDLSYREFIQILYVRMKWCWGTYM